MTNPSTHILITGASKGLGAALAFAWAKKAGSKLLITLVARDKQRLDQVAERCQAFGSKTQCIPLDLLEIETSNRCIENVDCEQAIDIAILNCGVSGDTSDGLEAHQQIETILNTNLLGTASLASSIARRMQTRQQGQLVFINSIASFRGLPLTPSYCASKAGLKAFADGLRGKLASDNIQVLSVYPGFVETDMTADYRGPITSLKKPEAIAEKIIRATEKRQAVLVTPLSLGLGQRLLNLLPPRMGDSLLRWLGYG